MILSFFFYLKFGFSAKITLTPGTVLGLIYGGNTAMGGKPAGTRSIATLSVWGLAPPPAVGGAPPPGLPGGMFPKITNMFLIFVVAKAQEKEYSSIDVSINQNWSYFWIIVVLKKLKLS